MVFPERRHYEQLALGLNKVEKSFGLFSKNLNIESVDELNKKIIDELYIPLTKGSTLWVRLV
jgi:hypothetical protein